VNSRTWLSLLDVSRREHSGRAVAIRVLQEARIAIYLAIEIKRWTTAIFTIGLVLRTRNDFAGKTGGFCLAPEDPVFCLACVTLVHITNSFTRCSHDPPCFRATERARAHSMVIISMEEGEIDDAVLVGKSLSDGFFKTCRRSASFRAADVFPQIPHQSVPFPSLEQTVHFRRSG